MAPAWRTAALENQIRHRVIEAAAIWIADSESLEMKILLARNAASMLAQYQRLQDRLSALGLAPGPTNPRRAAIRNSNAFFARLQTSEERVATGFLPWVGSGSGHQNGVR